jgi:hypothetical protein
VSPSTPCRPTRFGRDAEHSGGFRYNQAARGFWFHEPVAHLAGRDAGCPGDICVCCRSVRVESAPLLSLFHRPSLPARLPGKYSKKREHRSPLSPSRHQRESSPRLSEGSRNGWLTCASDRAMEGQRGSGAVPEGTCRLRHNLSPFRRDVDPKRLES